MNKIKKAIGISCLVVGVSLFVYCIVGLSLEFSKDPEIREVPRYDRFGNEIKELMCEEKIYDTGIYFAMIFPIGFLLVIAMILLVLSEERI